MNKFCLVKPVAQEFLKRLKNGEISPEKMNSMSSTERREFFETFMDATSARETNLLFEKKLLLKNTERGLIRWAEQLTGVTTEQRKAILKRVKEAKDEELSRMFNPGEGDTFLNELVDSRLGIGVSEEEARTIFALSKKIQDGRELFNKNTLYDRLSEIRGGDLKPAEKKTLDELMARLDASSRGKKLGSDTLRRLKDYLSGEKPTPEMKKKVDTLIDDIIASRKDALNYGAARVALDDYVGAIKLGIKEPYKMDMATMKRIVSDVAGFAKSVKSTLDNSFIGRQGIKTLYSGHPVIWAKTLVKSFDILQKSLRGQDMSRGVRASIYGRPNSMNGTYDLMKLAVGQGEEAFPASLPERIWILGRFFKATQEAFTGSAYYMRAELADDLIRKRIENGVDMTDKSNAESLGKLINSMTGRGTVGIGKLGHTTNTIFFSPKFFQSNLDTLTAHVFDTEMAPREKWEAAKNLAKIIASIGSTLFVAEQLRPGSVEWDPRSSDFGKIRIGDTRFDITGGMSSIVTLVARLWGTKSSTTGVMLMPNDYNGRDIIKNLGAFTENKLSPLVGILIDLAKREDFYGDPYTIKAFKEDPVDVTTRLVNGLIVPIPAGNTYKNFKEMDSGTALLYSLIDGLGVSANTYSYHNNWNKNTGKELSAFKEKVGKETFKSENEAYAKSVNDEVLKLRLDPKFLSLDDEDKQKVLEYIQTTEKGKIYAKHGFKYEREDGKEPARPKNPLKSSSRSSNPLRPGKAKDERMTSQEKIDELLKK